MRCCPSLSLSLSLFLSVPLASPFSHFYPLGAVVQKGVGEYSDGGMGGLDGHCIVHHNDAFYSSGNSYASSATFRPRALLKRAFEGKNLEVPPRVRVPLFTMPDRGVRTEEILLSLFLSSFILRLAVAKARFR